MKKTNTVKIKTSSEERELTGDGKNIRRHGGSHSFLDSSILLSFPTHGHHDVKYRAEGKENRAGEQTTSASRPEENYLIKLSLREKRDENARGLVAPSNRIPAVVDGSPARMLTL